MQLLLQGLYERQQFKTASTEVHQMLDSSMTKATGRDLKMIALNSFKYELFKLVYINIE